MTAAALVLTAAAAAAAQTTRPDAAAEAAAAMERAKRQAAGPMRVILEASKARRKSSDPEAAPAADAGSVRPVATRTAVAAPAPAPAEVAPRAVAAPSPAPAAAAAFRPPATDITAQATLSSVALQGKSPAAPVASLETSGVVSLAVPLPAATLSLPQLAAGPARPKLASRVDPDVSQRQLDELGRNAVVPVDLTIRADGTVAAVILAGSVPRGMQRVLVVALEQWRFDPLPAEMVHRVELLFNGAP